MLSRHEFCTERVLSLIHRGPARHRVHIKYVCRGADAVSVHRSNEAALRQDAHDAALPPPGVAVPVVDFEVPEVRFVVRRRRMAYNGNGACDVTGVDEVDVVAGLKSVHKLKSSSITTSVLPPPDESRYAK